jgi:hypothetical protein
MCLPLLLYQSINLLVSHCVISPLSRIVVVIVSMRLCQLVTLYWLGWLGVACSCCFVVAAGCCLILMLLACSISITTVVASLVADSPTLARRSIDLSSRQQSGARQCLSVVDCASCQCLLLVVLAPAHVCSSIHRSGATPDLDWADGLPTSRTSQLPSRTCRFGYSLLLGLLQLLLQICYLCVVYRCCCCDCLTLHISGLLLSQICDQCNIANHHQSQVLISAIVVDACLAYTPNSHCQPL